MTIELLEPFFGFSPEMWDLSNKFRKEIFKAAAKSKQKGLIFTYVWAFDQKEDWDYVNEICEIFESEGAITYFVELEADFDERIERNKSPHRLEYKPTKRNIEQSENELKKTMEKYRLNSREEEIQKDNYLKINNTNLSPVEVVEIITKKFNL